MNKDSVNTRVKDDSNGCGCIWQIVGVVVSSYILMSIIRVMDGGRNKLDLYLCYGTLIIFIIAIVLQIRDEKRDAKVWNVKRQDRNNSYGINGFPVAGGSYSIIRMLPYFYSEKPRSPGCWMAGGFFFIVGGLISKSMEPVVGGIFLLFVPVLGWGKYFLTKTIWLYGAVTSQVVVLGKKHTEADDAAAYMMAPRYAITHDEEWFLELGLSADQSANQPNVKDVLVKVKEAQYYKYHLNGLVDIHYKTSAPFVFLLEDEI